ncbi:MAG TPA: hypothetical protein VK188_19430 [Holophaga sp.]|nr:hypothetical protein [Holophaga sp.]
MRPLEPASRPPRPPFLAARRWIALAFLFLVVVYVGATAFHPCDERPLEETQVCHILCNDGCATAPIPAAPAPPPADPLPRPRFEAERPASLATLPVEPEKEPPRIRIA